MNFLKRFIDYMNMPAYAPDTPATFELYCLEVFPNSPEAQRLGNIVGLLWIAHHTITTRDPTYAKILVFGPPKEAPFLSKEKNSAEEQEAAKRSEASEQRAEYRVRSPSAINQKFNGYL